jgi:hypothetical protein
MRNASPTVVALGAVAALLLSAPRAARAEIPLVEQKDGWKLSTDGRINTFISAASGTGLPEEPDLLGAGTNDTKNANDDLQSVRIRNGFITSIFGATGQRKLSDDLNLTTRAALWLNITGSRTKNIPAQIDARELYGRFDGSWGSFLFGSDLALFGRGGILVDADIAHEYGLGYPCSIRDASGGACGMTVFGAPFPGFEPGLVYTTPNLAGLELSLGAYDPATIGNAQLNRAPLPRLEGELSYELDDTLRLFASGFWQVLEGTVNATPPAMGFRDLHVDAWGAQAGAMVSLGLVMVGGAAFQGAGFSPVTYVDESQIAADSAGVLRDSSGGFALGAVSIDSVGLKLAGGAGVFMLDKNENDSGPLSDTGAANDPRLLKRNLGITVGLYQTSEPVHLALEYFRAQHVWYDRGVPNAIDPTMVDIETPKQVVHFINAGVTVVW